MLFIHWKPLKGVTSFSLVRERFREAHVSETECRHKTGEVSPFVMTSAENPQSWIQHHPVNIIHLPVGKLQISAERK